MTIWLSLVYDTARAFARAGADPEVLVIRNLTPADVTASCEALRDDDLRLCHADLGRSGSGQAAADLLDDGAGLAVGVDRLGLPESQL